jgi:hypothetical protein
LKKYLNQTLYKVSKNFFQGRFKSQGRKDKKNVETQFETEEERVREREREREKKRKWRREREEAKGEIER